MVISGGDWNCWLVPLLAFTLAQVTSFELDESLPWTSLSTPKTIATITTAMPTLRARS